MPTGYCTVDDVRRTLQETGFSGALGEDSNQAVVNKIASQTQWLRSKTSRHWYEPDGVTGDSQNLVPTAPRTHGPEEGDIPSTPHPQHSTLFDADRGRYPLRMVGPYTRVRLDKHYVDSLTKLEVRDAGGSYTDWIADNTKEEGEDYRLYVEPGTTSSPSYIDLRVSSLPALRHYDGAVRVTYDYGAEGLSGTIREAVAMKTAAELLAPDDEANLGIPENANLQTIETKVQALERQAEEKLEPYL